MIRDRLHRRMSAAARVAVALAVVGAGFLVGQAPALAAPTGFFIEGRQFFSIDLATGESDLIGSTEVDENFSSLAFAPDGTLFAVADSQPDPELQQLGPAELYTIDVGTGAASLVGMLSENNDTGITLGLTALTFTQGGTALLSGIGSGVLETVFIVDIDGASGGLVPLSHLTDDSGFITVASDTACDGTVYGLSVEVPERGTDDSSHATPATVDSLAPPGQVPSGATVSGLRAQETPPVVGTSPPPGAATPATPGATDDDSLPLVLTTIDPATGVTTKIGPTSLGVNEFTIPGLAIDRATGTLWGEVIDGKVFTIDKTTGAADLPSGIVANEDGNQRRPQNLAISPVSCSQPTTTTTSTTTTTTSTTVVTADEPDPPPADPATPVPAEPNFTG